MRILASRPVIAGLAACGGGSVTEPRVGLEFCDKIMRPTSFRYSNADGATDFFDGLPVDCAAPDDLNTVIGADDDPNLITALSYLNTGACPVAAASDGKFKAEYTIDVGRRTVSTSTHTETCESPTLGDQLIDRPPSTAMIWPVT